MSFGFSVGDFVAVGNLIVKIVNILRGTQSEYQELIRELESLGRALTQVDKLKGRGAQAIAVDQIKCAALTCRYPLEDFLAKIQKFEKSLGLGEKAGNLMVAGRKIQYAFGKKDEANTLRNYLNLHIGTINMLLVRQGLEMLDVASEQTEKNQEELMDRIEFGGEIAAPLKSLGQTVANVCVSTQQIYTIVLELRASVLGIDTRFTYFQEPVKVEDALGRVFPFASECSIDALIAEIKARFREGPGRTEVMAGDFEIFNAKNADQVLTITGRDILLPGMSINMAIVLEKEFLKGDKCPMPHCASKTFLEAVGGGRTCCECNIWFDGPSKKRKRDSEGEQISKHVRTLEDRNYKEAKRLKTLRPILQEASGLSSDDEIAGTEQSDFEEACISAFKRIRFDVGLQTLANEDLVKLIDLKRDQIPYTDAQLRELLSERNTWASQNFNNDPDDDLIPKTSPSGIQISPDYLPSPEKSPTPERLDRLLNLDLRNKKRHPKAQATQADAVLIGFLGELNYPDRATKAGEVPLPESDDDSDNDLWNKKRHPKAQATQGDAVLIGLMGELNYPDLATKAGDVPLPEIDDSDVDKSMDAVESEQTDENIPVYGTVYDREDNLVHHAENALPLIK